MTCDIVRLAIKIENNFDNSTAHESGIWLFTLYLCMTTYPVTFLHGRMLCPV